MRLMDGFPPGSIFLSGECNSHVSCREFPRLSVVSKQWYPALVRYGQLGCSGFIISDQKGHFVSRKTKAFLDYGDDAYDDVEQILKNTLGIAAASHGPSDEGEDVMSPNFVLPSVGIGSMDHEHEQCELALATLLANPTAKSLTKALAELTGHFQHEEKLMRSNNFGNPGKDFSPYANHVKDHERILDLGYSELSKYESRKSSDEAVAIACESKTQ